MKNKKIILAIVSVLLLVNLFTIISAEVFLWDSVITDKTNSIVNYHGYYQFEDTTAQMSGANTEIVVHLWYEVQELPLILTGSYGAVDWCNFTIQHYKNTFDNLGNILNATNEIQSYYFTTGAFNSSIININAKNKDSIIADMKCHYNDSRGLYYGNILAGKFTTYISTYECSTCSDYSLEELSNMAKMNENITANELTIYDRIQTFVDWNFTIWLIVSWIVKIGLIFIAVALIFAGAYFLYKFISDMGKGLD
jgi:hypothetical protein